MGVPKSDDALADDALSSFLSALREDEADPDHRRSSDLLLVEGRLIADRYRVGARIARGGMASVWEATDVTLGRLVAIKFMGSAYAEDPEYRVRFEEEARAAASLRTPYVAAIHDHGTAQGVPYIVMERLDGEDLDARIRRLGKLPPAFVAKIAVEAGKALKAAHAAGIIHRDLKPKNLFVAVEDGEEIIKLLDFGVAKHAGTAKLMTATGVMLGSPFYMSPEQIRCERDLDARTDLWSLAAILYRALTGTKPFDGDLSAVMYKITRGKATPPSEIEPSLPAALDGFFEVALAQRREDRFASATAIAAAFQEAVTPPPTARDDGPAPFESGAREISPSPRGPAAPDDAPTAALPLARLATLAAQSSAPRARDAAEGGSSGGLRFASPPAPSPVASPTDATSEAELPAVLSQPPPAPPVEAPMDLGPAFVADVVPQDSNGQWKAYAGPLVAPRDGWPAPMKLTVALVVVALAVLGALAVVLATR